MAIQPNDPFDVLRHYIMEALPNMSAESQQELSMSLEALSERLDATDRSVANLAEAAGPAIMANMRFGARS